MTRDGWSVLVAALSLLAFAGNAKADALSAGNTAYQKGDLNKAIQKWQQSPAAEAAFRIATLAEEGKLKDCDPIICAATWYYKAGDKGHIPSITHLAILNFNNGYKEVGLGQFRLAARFNDTLARDLLRQMDQAVPEPDLYNQAIALEQQHQLARQAAIEQSRAQAAYMLGYLLGCGFGSACTLPAAPPSYGATPNVGSAPSPVKPYTARAQNTISAPPIQRPSASLCANGIYVSGHCNLAPDGSYVGGRPQMAPNGSFVAGQPRLAPNGQYVGGTGEMRLCPDGSYVSGGRCRLMPNGQYIGE